MAGADEPSSKPLAYEMGRGRGLRATFIRLTLSGVAPPVEKPVEVGRRAPCAGMSETPPRCADQWALGDPPLGFMSEAASKLNPWGGWEPFFLDL